MEAHGSSGNSIHRSELRIVLLGWIGSGKSSSGNTILGTEEFDLRTAQCVKRLGEVAGRQVTVVDTPGWWRDLPEEYTTKLVKQEIVRSVSLCPPGPHALLLVIQGGGSFTEKHRISVEKHLQLLNERVWSHTLVLFTHGDYLGDTTIEQHIQQQGKALQWLVEKCGNRYHVLNNVNRGDGAQVTELLDKIEEMVAGKRGRYYEIRAIIERERAEQQLKAVRLEFVKRVSVPVLNSLLDELRQHGVITQEEEESVKAVAERVERARHIIDAVLNKGAEACCMMTVYLLEEDSLLSTTLGLR